ncbi:hypothetical protein C0J52_04024 [Blattella germanica]|nr:hypothetical protein C0J52_04024 [Blattella germanica]
MKIDINVEYIIVLKYPHFSASTRSTEETKGYTWTTMAEIYWKWFCLTSTIVLIAFFSENQASAQTFKFGNLEKRALGGFSNFQSQGFPTFQKTSASGRKHGNLVPNNQPSFYGGCKEKPSTPQNSRMHCSIFSGCRATCLANYVFPNNETKLFITCNESKWKVDNGAWAVIPDCKPKCEPSCQNNGVCIKPNKCQCQPNYEGSHCQTLKKRTCNSKINNKYIYK